MVHLLGNILVMELLRIAKERLLDWSINPKKTKQKSKRFLFTIVVAGLYLPTLGPLTNEFLPGA